MPRSRITRWVAGLLATAIALTCAANVQSRIDTVRHDMAGEELLYLPSERLLTHFTAGMNSIVADILWIQCVKYTARHFKGDGKFIWLNHMCNLITRLDPYFVAAYRYGAIFLAALKADDDASLDLLHRGMKANPYSWELPYEAAMTWLLNRGSWPDSRVQTARYLAMAVETGRAPQLVLDIASGIQSAQNLTDMERTMWENTAKSDDKLMRELAVRKLTELDLRLACKDVNTAIDAYRQQTGLRIGSLEDLVAKGIIRGMPQDPLGGAFFLDSKGRLQSTTVLDGQVERQRNGIAAAVRAYKKDSGELPQSLQVLVQKGFLGEVPPHPYEDRRWQYDPTNGEIH